MNRTILLACLFAAGAPATLGAQAATDPQPPSAFESMKQLVGRWEGLSWDGAHGAVTYHLTGAGTALVETLLPGTRQEMMTIYHENAAGELLGNHYCIAGNQPEIELTAAGSGDFHFELSPHDRNVADGEFHGHEFRITLPTPDSLVLDWVPWRGDTPEELRRYRFRRVR